MGERERINKGKFLKIWIKNSQGRTGEKGQEMASGEEGGLVFPNATDSWCPGNSYTARLVCPSKGEALAGHYLQAGPRKSHCIASGNSYGISSPEQASGSFRGLINLILMRHLGVH